jgi:hypothetical protein
VAAGNLSGMGIRTASGSTVTVTGRGYAPFSRVAFGMYPASTYRHPVPLGTASAAANGTVQATLTIPASARGVQTIVASGVDRNGHSRYLSAQSDVEPATQFH